MIPPNEEESNNLIRNFIQATAKNKLSVIICASCAQETNAANIRTEIIGNLPNIDRLKPTTPHDAQTLYNGLLLCKEGLTQDGRSMRICTDCFGCLKNNTTPALSLANDMWIGDVPFELQNLHIAERLMISKGFPSAYIVKLYPKKKGAAKWGKESQFYSGLRGNVTTYKMDPAQMADLLFDNILPHPATILSAVIGVTFVGPKGSHLYGMPEMFRVRRWRVREALVWLTHNNPLYSDITISDERLAELPEDGIPEEIELTARVSNDIDTLNREGETYIPDMSSDDEEGEFRELSADISYISGGFGTRLIRS